MNSCCGLLELARNIRFSRNSRYPPGTNDCATTPHAYGDGYRCKWAEGSAVHSTVARRWRAEPLVLFPPCARERRVFHGRYRRLKSFSHFNHFDHSIHQRTITDPSPPYSCVESTLCSPPFCDAFHKPATNGAPRNCHRYVGNAYGDCKQRSDYPFATRVSLRFAR